MTSSASHVEISSAQRVDAPSRFAHPRRPFVLGAVLLVTVFAGPTGLTRVARAEEVLPPEELREIRLLDRVVLKDGREIQGEITTPLDASRIEVRSRVGQGTVSVAFQREEIGEITQRRTVDQVYTDWVRWTRGISSDRERLARALLALGKWCALPHPKLGGTAPRPASAHAHFERAVRLDPEVKEAYPWLLLLASEEHPIATAPLEALDRELETWLLAERAGAATHAMLLRAGEILATRAGLTSPAAVYLERVIAADEARDDERMRARELLATIRFESGDRDGAYRVWEEVLGSGSGEEVGHASPDIDLIRRAERNLLRLRLRAARPEDRSAARLLIERSLARDADSRDLLRELAALHVVEGRYEEALSTLAPLLEGAAPELDASLDRIHCLVSLGRLEDAGTELAKIDSASVANASTLARIERLRGLHAAREGRASDAVRAFERAREAMPESVIDRLILAEALIDAGERARATGELEAMRRAHAADPEVFAAASRLLARVRSMEGAPNDALRLLELAAEVFGDDAALLETVGLASLHAGENVRGAAFLQSAQRMAADRAGILAGLGYLRYGQGELDEAERLLASSQRSVDEAVEAPLSSWIETAMTAIRDLGRLEVWRDPFNGADGPMIDGWDAHELFGIDASLRGEEVVFEGVQRNDPQGETSIVLMRPMSASDFDKLSVGVKLGSGRGIPALRLEGYRGARQR
ncbi:MAG TPA: tetratricopeptide repeat protein, partial [Planctomycetota bacterium]|nr:tetratricopeptide repeat protein [Planctomycetota bacterium]